MAHRAQFQASRYEFKYLIDERRAQAMREVVKCYLQADDYALPENGFMYPVHSLYLDSPDLALYEQTLQGIKNRFKLRIRFYNDNPDMPAFFEVKQRVTNVIKKYRAGIGREGLHNILSGSIPDASHVISNGDGRRLHDFYRFCDLCNQIGAIGTAYVSYLREAYVAPDSNRVRVTFDRQLTGSAYDWLPQVKAPTNPTHANVKGVILELKFTDRFPTWMQELVETFELRRRSMAKYVKCVRAIGMSRRHGGLASRGGVR